MCDYDVTVGSADRPDYHNGYVLGCGNGCGTAHYHATSARESVKAATEAILADIAEAPDNPFPDSDDTAIARAVRRAVREYGPPYNPDRSKEARESDDGWVIAYRVKREA